MHSLVPQLICATLEKVLHKIVAMDPASPTLLQKVQSKQLALQLQELPWRFVLSATEQTLLLNQHNEKVDCVITTDLATLQKLNDPSQLTRLIKQDKLQIDGDLQVAQQFSSLLQQLNPDWQQHLSGWLGDALAHKVANAIQQLQLYIQTQLQQLEQATVELAHDELALSPTQAEMNQFSREVSQLQARLDQLSRHNAFRQE
jgi:ubiquinone biosynthesis accessory factor UbiJ